MAEHRGLQHRSPQPEPEEFQVEFVTAVAPDVWDRLSRALTVILETARRGAANPVSSEHP